MNSTAAEELFHEGVRRMGAGDSLGAEESFRSALRLHGGFAEAHANLALLLDQGSQWVEAETHYRQALELSPQQTQTLLNLGVMLVAQKRFAEAEAAYRRALALDPESPSGWSNLGVLLACMKREDEAEHCYRHVMTMAPAYRKAPFNLAYLLLRQGRYDEGWRCFEQRDGYLALERYLQACPRWRGEPLPGKSLLVGFEGGHGDMIQFCRYVALTKAQGAKRITVLCHPGLKSLFATLAGADEILAIDETVPTTGWDCWTPLLSFPFFFGTRLDTIPAQIPYLSTDPMRVRQWGEVLGMPTATRRVGLVWKGNPLFENDADRSLPSLATLAPLGEVVGVQYVSLQKGGGEDEIGERSSLVTLNLGPRLADFADTAAVLEHLDLIITVDTAVAHLAGALGKPCWVLLPDYRADWRWLTGREDSPWYPGVMRLFRQTAGGDWAPVVARVKAALRAWMAARA